MERSKRGKASSRSYRRYQSDSKLSPADKRWVLSHASQLRGLPDPDEKWSTFEQFDEEKRAHQVLQPLLSHDIVEKAGIIEDDSIAGQYWYSVTEEAWTFLCEIGIDDGTYREQFAEAGSPQCPAVIEETNFGEWGGICGSTRFINRGTEDGETQLECKRCGAVHPKSEWCASVSVKRESNRSGPMVGAD